MLLRRNSCDEHTQCAWRPHFGARPPLHPHSVAKAIFRNSAIFRSPFFFLVDVDVMCRISRQESVYARKSTLTQIIIIVIIKLYGNSIVVHGA